MPARVDTEWKGDRIKERFQRAIARGTIGVGEQISVRAKSTVHVISGDLRRSIHTAKHHTGGEQRANQQDALTPDGTGALVDVGSWLDYACVEENRGGEHSYMMPAIETVRGTAAVTYQAAFKQEGF